MENVIFNERCNTSYNIAPFRMTKTLVSWHIARPDKGEREIRLNKTFSACINKGKDVEEKKNKKPTPAHSRAVN